ncbi:translocase of chloroplast 90, chloroplastic-like isoform X2 [Iris pallida]|uniref:Translocase of chloroplast 90, chloroplastic-like isoform X2 n=1 Tax=Iris pallida TaxID=29817 RepID=A0AAX6IJ50_IRIPA|nr:translocase of chloroplast 90, chloroplastic-like isoform X2 [Iris pallida]
MKDFKEWLSYQWLSKSLLSARPFSFFYEESPDGERSSLGTRVLGSAESMSSPAHTSSSQGNASPERLQPVVAESSYLTEYSNRYKATDPATRVEALQIDFFRLVRRIGQSPANPVVPQVLYRLHLASLIRATESNIKRPALKIDQARAMASELEAVGQSDLDFSFKILVLGKTGVGKSATINSIFDHPMVLTDAFHPATDKIQEVTGAINGIRVTVIDTPGLSPSNHNQRRNRKILFKVKRFVRRSPPDVVLYFERLDVISRWEYSDHRLLKLITEVFGASIWCNTILVMTHASSLPPQASGGYSIDYDSYVGERTNLLQHFIHQAAENTDLENPVLLVENHPQCRRNSKGEKVLPNGQVWISQFLLLCVATKVLGDANLLLRFQDSFQVAKSKTKVPSLPHLLSSLLHPRNSSEDEFEELPEDVEDDEYDQLPPIRILTKAQYRKLSKEQRKAYLDELDYRETLYLKKEWKAEIRRQKENKDQGDNYENDASQELVQLPDISVPLSFDPDSPKYRYRSLVGSTDQWFVRPVLDSHGWDHDVGFDGVNIETSQDLNQNVKASVVGQISKDKEGSSIQLESAVKYVDPKGRLLLTGIDMQSAGKDLVSVIRGETNFRNLGGQNVTGVGLTVTSFGKLRFFGAKVEDSVRIGKRCKMMVNAGRVAGASQAANGGSLEVTVRGRDHPVRDEKVKIAASVLSLEKEMVLGGTWESDFRLGRAGKLSVNANLNSRRLGQLSLKVNSSEHIEIGIVAVVVSLLLPLFRGIRRPDAEE